MLTISHKLIILLVLAESHEIIQEVYKLTKAEDLSKLISQAGFTNEKIACELGITRQGLFKKLRNKTEFKQSEIAKLSKLLGLDNNQINSIFLERNVTFSHVTRSREVLHNGNRSI